MAYRYNPDDPNYDPNADQEEPPDPNQSGDQLPPVASPQNTGVAGPAPAASPAPSPQPAGSFDRMKFRDMWMSQGGGYGGDVQRFINEHPDFATGVTGSKDKWTLPTGEQIDLVGDVGGANAATWTGYGPSAGGGGGGGGGGLRTGGGFNAGAGGAVGTGLDPTIRQGIMDLLRNSQQPVNVDALNASPEAQAYRRVAERELMRNRAQAAESAAARGVGAGVGGEQGGGLQSAIGQGQEGLAERMQGMQSQLVGRELQNRREGIAQALQLGAGVMGRDQEAQLRRELAALDAQLQREGRGSQERMFGQGQDYNYDVLALKRKMWEDQQNNPYSRSQPGID